MSSPSERTPSLMARFKEEAELQVVEEDGEGLALPEQPPPPPAVKRAPSRRSPKPRPGPRSRKAAAKSRSAQGRPPPPKPKASAPPELSALMGSPKDEMMRASRIYTELLSRPNMGEATLKRLEQVIEEMGLDPEQLKAQMDPASGAGPPPPASPSAAAKEKGRAKAKAKPKAKTRPAPRPKTKPQQPSGTDLESLPEVAPCHCPRCAKEAEPEWTHCPWCGGDLPPRCVTCRQELAPDWRFCPYCGQKGENL